MNSVWIDLNNSVLAILRDSIVSVFWLIITVPEYRLVP